MAAAKALQEELSAESQIAIKAILVIRRAVNEAGGSR